MSFFILCDPQVNSGLNGANQPSLLCMETSALPGQKMGDRTAKIGMLICLGKQTDF